MGFLDHSTNNIIIDAVLTDEGRYLLAQGSDQFDITYFALADDEVDYTLIQKFGRSVGKEKISKNTPVFEASTVSDYALKHKLKSIGLGSGMAFKLPTYTLSSRNAGLSGNTVSFTKGVAGQTTRELTVTVEMVDGQSVPTDIRDDLFFVYEPKNDHIDQYFWRITNETGCYNESFLKPLPFPSVNGGVVLGNSKVNFL